MKPFTSKKNSIEPHAPAPYVKNLKDLNTMLECSKLLEIFEIELLFEIPKAYLITLVYISVDQIVNDTMEVIKNNLPNKPAHRLFERHPKKII